MRGERGLLSVLSMVVLSSMGHQVGLESQLRKVYDWAQQRLAGLAASLESRYTRHFFKEGICL